MSVITTLPPKGEIYPITLQPKGEIEKLQFAKGQLEELTAEYNFTKPQYTLEETTEAYNKKKFFIRCLVEDQKRGNKFSTLSNVENRIRSAEQEAAKKMLATLRNIYYFSEEKNVNNMTDESYVICLDNPATSLIKLYKWGNCCEYCYLRGHTMATCRKQIKRNKRLLDDQETAEEDF